jgi:DNA recombination protein RmuC
MLKSLASLNQRLGHNEKLVNTVWSALSTPQAVGNFAEIGLENTLKNYGLVPGRDFIMQYSIKTQTTDLRPDAVVFLSADNVMVIDSKASKFFLESESDDEALRGEKLEQLKKSMNDHLKALSTKAYHESIKEYIKAGGKQSKVGHIYTIMFVHNESVLHKLLDVDPEFMQKAQTKDVVVSGPTGLAAAMSLARFDIVSQKQSENYARIVDEVGALLGSLETLLKHAERMGRGVTSVATSFQKFSASVNRSFLPKARKLVQLGVTLPKNKELPGQLPNVHVSTEESYVIEGEAVANQSEEDVALLNKDDQAG